MSRHGAILTEVMARQGRGGDSHMGHLSSGDVVVPRAIVLKDPTILVKMKKLMEEEGGDYRTHVVGSGHEKRNPITHAPEFNFFSNLFKTVLKAVPAVGGAIVGGALGGPAGAAAGSALGTKISGGSNTQALLSAGGSYLGGQFLGSGAGDVAGNLTQSSIPGAASLGENLANGSFGSLGSAVGAASYPTIAGSLSGQALTGLAGGGDSMAGILGTPVAEDTPNSTSATAGPQNAPLPTSRPQEAALPSGFSQFEGLDPLQQGTGIATQGLYGGGTSDAEQNYFVNLLQRQLIDDKGGYQDYGNNVNPTEESYLHNNLGLQFDPNTPSLLQAIANRGAAAA